MDLPFTSPFSTDARRERLLLIGSANNVHVHSGAENSLSIHTDISRRVQPTEETRVLRRSNTSYGTLTPSPNHQASSFGSPTRRPFSQQRAATFLRRTLSSTTSVAYPTLRARALSRLTAERPISAYDAPLNNTDDVAPDTDAKINGIRVWYSSFSSIDWLHDSIKDSVRFARLRKRHTSLRGRIRSTIDKSLGWFVVTVVGFLSAVLAFLVVRSEQWLFDFKEGYCRGTWWKAKHFCCRDHNTSWLTNWPDRGYKSVDQCPEWRTWSSVFLSGKKGLGADAAGYSFYLLVAILMAVISCFLTISLTDSSTFATRKESGVLRADFDLDKLSETAAKRRVMYYAAGSGIPEIKTILSGFVIHGYLGGRTLFTKAVGLAFSVSSGLSLGKEGPFVHIASCIGNIVSRFSSKYENNEAKRREILSAACAAGVAVAFGAPIGGTLFSLEEVSYFFPPKVMWRSFFCAMVAAITLKMLDPFGTGKLVLFQVTYDKDWYVYELFPFILLGIFGGIYGAYFSKLNYAWSKNIRNGTWLRSHPMTEVILITSITTLFCFVNPYTRMGGTELVYNLFAECRQESGIHPGLCVLDPRSFQNVLPVISAIALTMVIKAGLTVVTFGIKVPAGIFIPSLAVGACAGRIVGIIMKCLHWRYSKSKIFATCNDDMDCIIPGLYAMVGAAGTLSGVTRTTVSLAVIMFELTDTLTYAVPVMLSVLVAKTVADALEPKGIYDLVIELNQLPYLDSKHEYLWGSLQIGDVTMRNAGVIRLDKKNTVKSLRDQLLSLTASGSDDGGFPILKNYGGLKMIGYIGANELEHALSIVADDDEEEVYFHTTYSYNFAPSSASSLSEDVGHANQDFFDFSIYMDQAPLTVQSNSPLEMVQQFFVKLGARYVVVTDPEGFYEGVIDKKTWLAFLAGLEEK